MKTRLVVIFLIFTLVISGMVLAADYKCIGDRIEKSGSTWGYAKISGSDYRIEKGSSTIAFVKSRSGKWAIEDAGNNTLGWLNGSSIETTNGSTWASLSDAKSFCDGPDPVAAAMWVLNKTGKL
ncbi:MAG TPA: hypothetical protein VF531_16290 [Bacillota bacterium]